MEMVLFHLLDFNVFLFDSLDLDTEGGVQFLYIWWNIAEFNCFPIDGISFVQEYIFSFMTTFKACI